MFQSAILILLLPCMNVHAITTPVNVGRLVEKAYAHRNLAALSTPGQATLHYAPEQRYPIPLITDDATQQSDIQQENPLNILAAASSKELQRIRRNSNQKKYSQNLKSSKPDQYQVRIEKQHIYNRIYRDKVKSDSAKLKARRQRQRETAKNRREKVNSDPSQREAIAEKQKETYQRYKESLKRDPVKKEAYLQKKREADKARREKKKQQQLEAAALNESPAL